MILQGLLRPLSTIEFHYLVNLNPLIEQIISIKI
nr:MAG TPA: hypothetical protein [Caudoviricetes sp.]